MKKLILLTLALTFLLILSQQALSSKDINYSDCEKPRYGFGSGWYCIKNSTFPTAYLPPANVPGEPYPTSKVILEGFLPAYDEAIISCYKDFSAQKKVMLKKLGLSPQKGKSEWFHKWLQNSNIYTDWEHILRVNIVEGYYAFQANSLWMHFHCPITFYNDYNNYQGEDYAQFDFKENITDIERRNLK